VDLAHTELCSIEPNALAAPHDALENSLGMVVDALDQLDCLRECLENAAATSAKVPLVLEEPAAPRIDVKGNTAQLDELLKAGAQVRGIVLGPIGSNTVTIELRTEEGTPAEQLARDLWPEGTAAAAPLHRGKVPEPAASPPEPDVTAPGAFATPRTELPPEVRVFHRPDGTASCSARGVIGRGAHPGPWRCEEFAPFFLSGPPPLRENLWSCPEHLERLLLQLGGGK
jgi:hypothetical protein